MDPLSLDSNCRRFSFATSNSSYSPHAVTGTVGLSLLTIQCILCALFEAGPFLVHYVLSFHSWEPGLGNMNSCGYPAINASYYDLSFHPISSNKDCKLYQNFRATKCYNCNSCKAGVAQYIS